MTALQELIEKIREQQDKYIELSNKNKDLKVGTNAILTATTLIIMQAQVLLEKEKQQIARAYEWGKGDEQRGNPYENGNKYYEDSYE